jgi:hypothetical protein
MVRINLLRARDSEDHALANLAYKMRRLAWTDGSSARA